MVKKFTPNHLIKYLYKETSASESLAIAEALEEDWELNEEFTLLQKTLHNLPKARFNPSSESLKKIVGYSHKAPMETF